MKKPSPIEEYIHSLVNSKRLGAQVVYRHVFPETPAVWGKLKDPLPGEMAKRLSAMGLSRLYRHQSESINLVRSGRHVVVATPTASGKTLVYNLPFLETVLLDDIARGLYIFPLKALAQDQLQTFKKMAETFKSVTPTARIYDGDTSAWHRRKIRETPPNVILTNPEMLHLALLPYHQKWVPFFSNLKLVVIDEVHSSQSGETSKHLKKSLSKVDDEEDIDYEEVIRREIESRGKQTHISFFGFTGTPKNKTLELFGRKNPKGEFESFHYYLKLRYGSRTSICFFYSFPSRCIL